MKSLLLAAAAASLLPAQADISGARIRPHVKFLSSDLLEGRGVGTRGGELATAYLAAQFEALGAKPAGDNGTFFQEVPLAGVEPKAETRLSFAGKSGTLELRWLEDFVGNTMQQKESVELNAEAVFAGHGITAPEHKWDDFKGVDVRGKVLVVFTNEPQSDDPKLFGGRALTNSGRWTYKFEEALRRGAAGCIIVHTTPTAGYGWEVVRSSWSKEDTQVKLTAQQAALPFAGWVTREIGEKLFAMAGQTVDDLLKASDSRDFKPIPLGVRVLVRGAAKVRQIETANVAAIIPGSDARLSEEAVIFSAHWDHLGIGLPVAGDRIYNGAVDNATGCAMLIEIARAWAALERKPKRSALFLAVTAEEGGLRGSAHYAAHPVIPAAKTALAINMDAFYPFGRTNDVVVTGAERTAAYGVVEEAARRMQLEIAPDPRPEQGSYFRSDHFSFAKAGIPAFSIHAGSKYAGKPEDFAAKTFRAYNAKNYHQPSDEYSDDWDVSGMEQMARFAFLIGFDTANLDRLPGWK